jgi:hypothetical protein
MFASRRQQTSLPPTVARKGKRWFASKADAPRKGNMDQSRLQTYLEVRKTLIERLTRLSFTETMLGKMSVFQLVSLLHLMAGPGQSSFGLDHSDLPTAQTQHYCVG